MLILQALLNGILLGGVYATFSAGFSLIFGVMGVVNIAHGEMIMLGAFVTYYLFHLLGLDPFISLPISFGLMFLLGYLLQRLVINRVIGAPPIMSYILTFGLHLVIANVALLAWTADPRTITTAYSGASLSLGPLHLPVVQGVTFLFCLGIIYGLHFLLHRTQVGRAIQATAQDREMARLMGINVGRIFALTFGLGAGVTALAGSLVAAFRHVEVGMGLPYTVIAFCVVVLGGMGYIPGALVGGLILGVVGSVSTAIFTPGWSMAITFFLLYLMLLFRPAGVTGKGIVE
jgi:branched-chain amino acid transport system permease protein